MTDTRKGLNATLTYLRDGKTPYSYSIRAGLVSYGVKVIYDESQARIRKAFYPHRLSSAPFSVGVLLVGEKEFVSFNRWLSEYATYLLTTDLSASQFPAMAVSIPSRRFLRRGVPTQGFAFGDHVGAMIWTPTIIFESAEEPSDPSQKSLALSRYVKTSASLDPATEYFYPTSTQLSGNEAPPDGTYVLPMTAAAISALLKGASPNNASSVVSDWRTSAP